MSSFIAVRAVDPLTDKDDCNKIYLRPQNIVHIEPWSGPFNIMAWGPDGRCVQTGRTKDVLGGTMILLAVGGQRVLYDKTSDVLERIEIAENGYPTASD